ncbi:unnamed protein product [Rotaria sp. Silwood1]|nr:unnamed protein product [Rotaria sp. Silwood1]CAF4753011.1 unnamed protein product [Rotaria sp. Silwood1]
MWYQNIVRVEHLRSVSLRIQNHKDDISSILIIHTDDQPKRFIYSVNSWLLETNFIELKVDLQNTNLTSIEWSVYTQNNEYLLFPFAKFYKKSNYS